MTVGKAYAFFDCKEPKEKIEEEIRDIREVVGTPEGLELSLTDKYLDKIGDTRLINLARGFKMKYGMQAFLDDTMNREVAVELVAILNQACQSPLYSSPREFRGKIVFEEEGRYQIID